MDKKPKIVFVTVGTTYFDELIQKFDQENILKALSDFGYNKIIFQVGKGTYEPINYKKFDKLQGEVFKYKPSLIDDLKSAHLVVSHCGISLPLFILKLKGAGTLLECLRLGKKVIGVINERLMDNHQVELLDALEKSSYMLGFRTMSQVDEKIREVLEKIEKGSVKEYPAPLHNKIDSVIEELF